VQGLKCVSEVARTMQAVLSSKTFDGGRLSGHILQEGFVGCNDMKLFVLMSCKMRRKGSRSRKAVKRAIYLLSVVESAISLCSLLHHTTGQSQNKITYPVLDKTLSRNSLYSLCHRPAKSASTYMLRAISAEGLRTNLLSAVASKYRVTRFTAKS